MTGALAGLRRSLPRRLDSLLAGAGASVAVLHYRLISRAVVERAPRIVRATLES